MKSTGIVRRIDELGRFVVPKEIRRNLGVSPGVPMEIFMDGNKIILQKFRSCCSFCGETGHLFEYKGVQICQDCIDKMNKLKEGQLNNPDEG